VTAYRPKLRAHLRVEDGQIVDGLLRRELAIEGTALAVAARLDGDLPWDELRAALAGEGHDPADLDSALRGLLLLHFVEGAGDELTGRLARVVAGEEEVPTAILDGVRFACQGSGACCSGYSFGPLSDADVTRLGELDLAGRFPALAPPYLEERDTGRYLRKTGDACIFLAADRRCGLHAAFGADAKPHFCRLYPLDSFGTVDGWRIVDRGTCATFGVSARSGLPLYDDLPRVHALLDPPVLHHPIAVVDGRGWDHGLFLRFTGAALDLAGRGLGSALDTVGAIARWLDALAQGLERCPLERGQPDQMASWILDIDGAVWYRPPRPEAARRGLRLVGELIEACATTVTAALDDDAAAASAPRLREFRAAADRVAATIARAVDDELEPPAVAHAADVEDALRTSLRQQLFGRHVLAGGHAGAGLVRIGLVQLFALAGGRRQAGARPLAAADLSRGHMLAMRTFHTNVLEDLLGDNDEHWRDLIDGLPLAARVLTAAPSPG
jgi:Fe-S-cluster containining protein